MTPIALISCADVPKDRPRLIEHNDCSAAGSLKALCAVALLVFAAALAGCKAATPNTESLVAIDCSLNRGYVPLPILNAQVHGQIAVLDLSANPDTSNALLKVIDINMTALARGMAVDIQDGLLLAAADNGSTTGSLLLVDESTFNKTAVPFPTGSRPKGTDGVVFDPLRSRALVSMNDAADCPTAGTCTGAAVFNLSTRTFGPVLQSEGTFGNFAVDFISNASLASSDAIDPLLVADNLAKTQACTLDDQSVATLDADAEGLAVDPTTHIWVAGNFTSPTATIINLNRASFSSGPQCTLDESLPPNSINFNTGTGALGMPGVAINPLTHEALLTGQNSNQVALLDLPSLPVTKLTSSRVSGVHSTVPNDPDGNPFLAATFPYGDTIDVCNNLGYVLEKPVNYLAQIDLSKLRKRPTSISLPLPSGGCFGTTTSFKCGNGSGVKFFPLPTS
jgi:hypothetical protein